MLAAGSLGVVVSLIAVVELFIVKLAHTCDGIGAIHALDGTLLILIGVTPGNSLSPVEMRSHRIPVAVLLDFKLLVATVRRVGKTLADDGIAHPEDKLLIFRVGYLSLVHPEGIN